LQNLVNIFSRNCSIAGNRKISDGQTSRNNHEIYQKQGGYNPQGSPNRSSCLKPTTQAFIPLGWIIIKHSFVISGIFDLTLKFRSSVSTIGVNFTSVRRKDFHDYFCFSLILLVIFNKSDSNTVAY
jgi:hypothetical protein